MTITIQSVSRCAGNSHIHIDGSMNGQARRWTISKDDMELEDVSLGELVIARLRSAVKEANATTPNQIRNALEGKTFKV